MPPMSALCSGPGSCGSLGPGSCEDPKNRLPMKTTLPLLLYFGTYMVLFFNQRQ